MSAAEKVLLEVRHSSVSVQILGESDGQASINPRAVFFHLGEVRQVSVPSKRGHLVVWQWASEGYSGQAATKREAVDAMLMDAGYEAVPLTATVPPLFEIEAAL